MYRLFKVEEVFLAKEVSLAKKRAKAIFKL